MGSVRTRANGQLFFDFRYQGKRCREYTRLSDTARNRKRLERVLQKIEAEITLGTFDYAAYFPNSPKSREFAQDWTAPQLDQGTDNKTPTPSFGDFAEKWFHRSEVAWKGSYRGKVRDILDGHLLPAFGDRPVGELTREAVLDYRAELVKGGGRAGKTLSAGRVNQIIALLRAVLGSAADQYAFRNPADGIKPLREQRPTVDPFALEEVQQFLEVVDWYYRDYFLVRFLTGLRTSEIDGLQWRYVDLENSQIHVRETLVKGEVTTTKTPSSERFVDLSSPVAAALRRQWRITGGVPNAFVFQAPAGGPIHYRNVSNRIWYPTLRRLGFRSRRPYQTRHTAATLWLAAGESPEWIARQLGHTDTNMLFSTYSRYVPNLTRRDGSAVEQLLTSRFPLLDDQQTGVQQ